MTGENRFASVGERSGVRQPADPFAGERGRAHEWRIDIDVPHTLSDCRADVIPDRPPLHRLG
jgi:hypothetical protein